nr:MAG TPA: Lumazine binding domain [Caudoviricetes sp.]
MGGAFPLPLSAREISDWVESHPSPMTRDELDAVMFALDGVCLTGDDE